MPDSSAQKPGILKACVIGWPIKHSRSPLIHRFWLQKYGISGSYEKIAVPPEELSTFLNSLSDNGFAGCNVTIPHKEKVFEQIKVTDTVTLKIGAVNTVYRENNKQYGLNTDGYGFISNLKSKIPSWQSTEKTCVIIGAGGAARAIIAILLADGIKTIFLVNRTIQRAQTLAQEFGPAVQPCGFEQIESCLKTTDLLVNTTSLGMTGQPPLEISLKSLSQDCVVSDIVYDPLETDLLKKAKLNGNQTVDGLGMLLHQAVPGFEKWFGIRPQVTDELTALVIEDLMRDKTA